jgi:acyl carrier protein
MDSTFERLKAVLLKTYPLDPSIVRLDQPLDELGIDSLGVGLLLFDVEDAFKIKFSADPGPIRTVGDVVSFIDGVLEAQHREAQASPVSSLPSS